MSSPSLWQQQYPGRRFGQLTGELRRDVCVVGAGVTGGACAWRLMEQGVSVAIVEARAPAAAASGRNGGFAVTGTAMEYPQMVERLGAATAGRLQHASEAALDEMIAMAAELGVADAIRRTGSLWLGEGDEREHVAECVRAVVEAGVRCRLAPELIPAPMRGRDLVAALFDDDAELMPAAWVRALVAGCADRGAAVFERSPVTAIVADGDSWTVSTAAGTVHSQAVVVACDGLIPRLVPEMVGVIYPVRGQVAATAPLANVPLEMPTHSQHGFMYYRPTRDGRVVVGGGRLQHLEDEYTDEERTTPAVQAQLDAFLRDWLALGAAPITHRWAGIMGFSADLLPVAGEVPGRPVLHVAGGYSGVGNVHGHLCGRLVADLIATGDHPDAAEMAPARFCGRVEQQLEKRSSRELARTSAVTA